MHLEHFILVLIDAFSRWVELFPTKTTTALESASCIFQHMGRFGTPDVVHTDRGTAFHNELVSKLLRMTGTEQSLATAYSSEENGIVERANQKVLCDVVLVDDDGRPHRLVQGVPLAVSVYEVVKCRKRIALPESLKDGENLSTRLPHDRPLNTRA